MAAIEETKKKIPGRPSTVPLSMADHRDNPECLETLSRLFPGSAHLGSLRQTLAAAHHVTAHHKMDDLVWNHISARENSSDPFIITPGHLMFEEIEPGDLVVGKDSANGTGDVIHGSIYGVRNDVMAVCHTHTDAITAVSCLKGGLQFLSQDSGRYFERVAYHDYEGLSDDYGECARLAAVMTTEQAPGAGLPVALLMRNHGGVTVGRTIEEAWVRMYYLDVCCKAQLLTMGKEGQTEIDAATLRHLRTQYDNPELRDGLHEWPALLRRAVRAKERQGGSK